jgi:hypothetical protein
MRILYDEVLRRFPEIRNRLSEGDQELPYLLVGYLADWLKETPSDEITPALVKRVVEFTRWCEGQPSGRDAGDDIPTIMVVGFYEKLFEHESTRLLIPHLMPREHVTRNADYLRQWVGDENYEKALRQYDRKV